jgi:hypothetical protein
MSTPTKDPDRRIRRHITVSDDDAGGEDDDGNTSPMEAKERTRKGRSKSRSRSKSRRRDNQPSARKAPRQTRSRSKSTARTPSRSKSGAALPTTPKRRSGKQATHRSSSETSSPDRTTSPPKSATSPAKSATSKQWPPRLYNLCKALGSNRHAREEAKKKHQDPTINLPLSDAWEEHGDRTHKVIEEKDQQLHALLQECIERCGNHEITTMEGAKEWVLEQLGETKPRPGKSGPRKRDWRKKYQEQRYTTVR